MLNSCTDRDLATAHAFLVKPMVALGITGLIGYSARNIADTGQHRILATMLEKRVVTVQCNLFPVLGVCNDLRDTGFRLPVADFHAAGLVLNDIPVAPAEIQAHHSIGYPVRIGHGLVALCLRRIVMFLHCRLKSRHVIRHPDMPTPDDIACQIAHGHDGIALFDCGLRHFEEQYIVILQLDICH